MKTLPQITEHFIATLSGQIDQLTNPENYPNSSYMNLILEAHSSQKQIGYQAFFKGFLCKKWYEVQALFYRNQRVDRK